MAPKNIGIVANPFKDQAKGAVCSLHDAFAEKGVNVVVAQETADFCGVSGDGISLADLGNHVELIVVLGGDGTILHVVHATGAAIKPMAAINMGRLGFLTCATRDEQAAFVELIAGGDYVISRRSTIQATIHNAKGGSTVLTGLNEAVIGRGNSTRMIGLEVRVNGQFLNRYGGDGLIIATPTGSTAYSLSAGGPIISPESNVFVLTPICSHALSNRSIVIEGDVEMIIDPQDLREETVISMDGRARHIIEEGMRITLKRGPYDVPLIMPADYRFYTVLQQKLGWRGSNV
ncbi:MAG: NAD(+)/NADH kinase [Verrucomicrobia bacterium]|nr:NAD(+)/NADH kinase [Verrucomicrobiota bacterium]